MLRAQCDAGARDPFGCAFRARVAESGAQQGESRALVWRQVYLGSAEAYSASTLANGLAWM